MDQHQSTTLEYVKLACGVDGCPHSEGFAEIADPNGLTEADAVLLNRLLEEAPGSFSEAELARLNELLSRKLECPVHGREHLGYNTQWKFNVTAEFEFVTGDEEDA